MTNEELKKIIGRHEKWLISQEGGECANLRDANLRGADLHGASLHGADLCDANLYYANLYCADLYYANLSGANLSSATLSSADLSGADLSGADLSRADLRCADLRCADLSCADLYYANLRDADLSGANLSGANLSGANLSGANLSGAKNVPYIPMACPDSGSFIAWKKADEHIVKLLIPEDARRSSATGRKCRSDKAFVVAIETVNGEPAELDEIASDYDDKFIYKVGVVVSVDNFCEDRFIECAAGIHFFINRQEAVDYN